MVKSRIHPDKINYDESKDIEDQDIGHETSVYEISAFDTSFEIALGNPRYQYSRQGVIFFPIFLIVNEEPVLRIGVYEIENDKIIGDIDNFDSLELYGENLLFFVSKAYILRAIDKNAKPAAMDAETADDDDVETAPEEPPATTKIAPAADTNDVMRLIIPPQKQSETIAKASEIIKTGVFVENPNAKIPDMLEEETQEISDEIKAKYHESIKTTWMEKFMKNNHYGIVDNEGGGDCFFAVIRDAFAQIGKTTTVEKLRALLSREATEELFQHYRTLYVNFLAEFQEKEKELTSIKKTSAVLKKRGENTKDKNETQKIIGEAKELLDKHKRVTQEKDEAKQLLNEFAYMKDIDSLEKMRAFIQTRHYWADTWAISTLDKLLNIKVVVFSEESFSAGDLDSVLNCGQLNDADLERQGNFKPDFYVMTSYTGNHYKLVTYKDKHILRFKEIPFDVKVLIINKCMEKNAGPYYLIQDLRQLKTRLGLNANEGEPADSDDEYSSDKELYDSNTTFMFHAASNSQPKAGKGSGEKIAETQLLEYNLLNKIAEWRKKLDDSWSAAFTLDGHRWTSVEHYFLGSQYKKGFPDFYLQFSIDSGSQISKNLEMAKAAASKTGKFKEHVLRERNIKTDTDFYEVKAQPRYQTERGAALAAKFTQNVDLKDVLLKTKKAKLVHFLRGKEPEVDELLMRLRKDLA
jgi:predicted NAD-dependent protein-ADP-ribosyltransferase YbiA (DUF1768 family)